MPRLPKGKKSPSDDDPFWDSWDEEPIAKENRAPLRRSKTKKKTTMNAASTDPFGRDGFGDGWDYKPVAKFDSDDHDDLVPQEDFSAEADWGTRRQRRETERREEIKRKREREYRLSRLKKEREAAAEVEAAAAAAAEAAAEAEAAAAKTAAEEKWQFKVKQATDCIALADPSQALTILYSLSMDNEIVDYIETKEKNEVVQLYAALYNHFELQNFLSSTLPDYLDRSSSKTNESSIDESTIGGDTVEANHSNTEREEEIEGEMIDNTVAVVDRLPSYRNSETETKTKTNESSSIGSTTAGGDTVKVNHLNSELEDEDSEIGKATVVVDRSTEERKHAITLRIRSNQSRRTKRASDGDYTLPFDCEKGSA